MLISTHCVNRIAGVGAKEREKDEQTASGVTGDGAITRSSPIARRGQSDQAWRHIMSSRDQTMQHRVVSRDEWLAARKAHLKSEKALTRMRDLVAAERRALPWVKVEKEYVFDTRSEEHTSELQSRFDLVCR